MLNVLPLEAGLSSREMIFKAEAGTASQHWHGLLCSVPRLFLLSDPTPHAEERHYFVLNHVTSRVVGRSVACFCRPRIFGAMLMHVVTPATAAPHPKPFQSNC